MIDNIWLDFLFHQHHEGFVANAGDKSVRECIAQTVAANVRFGSFATEPFSASVGQCPLLLQ
jgi:hypothetical protein